MDEVDEAGVAVDGALVERVLADVAAGATVDRHAADQLLIFAALADGVSTYRAPGITGHMQSAAWLAALFLDARVDLADDGMVTVAGEGATVTAGR